MTWACVSLADKLDTLVGLFLAGERPTGSRDPFGLRRQAHGVLRILLDAEGADRQSSARRRSANWCDAARQGYGDAVPASDEALAALDAFLRERLEFVLEQRGAAAGATCARSSDRGRSARSAAGRSRAEPARRWRSSPRRESFRQARDGFKRVRNIARELGDDAGAAAAICATRPEGAGRSGAARGDRQARTRDRRGGRRRGATIARRIPKRRGSSRRSRRSSTKCS